MFFFFVGFSPNEPSFIRSIDSTGAGWGFWGGGWGRMWPGQWLLVSSAAAWTVVGTGSKDVARAVQAGRAGGAAGAGGGLGVGGWLGGCTQVGLGGAQKVAWQSGWTFFFFSGVVWSQVSGFLGCRLFFFFFRFAVGFVVGFSASPDCHGAFGPRGAVRFSGLSGLGLFGASKRGPNSSGLKSRRAQRKEFGVRGLFSRIELGFRGMFGHLFFTQSR